jgi:phosphoenolpyruvate carboxylase
MDMNWKFFRSIVATLAMLLLASGASFAQDYIEQLGLSARQKEQITELRDQTKKESKPILDEIKRLLDEEKRLRKSGAPEAELRRIMKLRADKEIELSLSLRRFNEKFESILTPDQKRTLQSIIDRKNKTN